MRGMSNAKGGGMKGMPGLGGLLPPGGNKKLPF